MRDAPKSHASSVTVARNSFTPQQAWWKSRGFVAGSMVVVVVSSCLLTTDSEIDRLGNCPLDVDDSVSMFPEFCRISQSVVVVSEGRNRDPRPCSVVA